jgi:hypothetical protein
MPELVGETVSPALLDPLRCLEKTLCRFWLSYYSRYNLFYDYLTRRNNSTDYRWREIVIEYAYRALECTSFADVECGGGSVQCSTRYWDKVLNDFNFVNFFIYLSCAYKIGFISALLNSPYLPTGNIQWEKKASGNLSK